MDAARQQEPERQRMFRQLAREAITNRDAAQDGPGKQQWQTIHDLLQTKFKSFPFPGFSNSPNEANKNCDFCLLVFQPNVTKVPS
ncbi:hypothetical protein PG995_015783 [Apiospora arundinis]